MPRKRAVTTVALPTHGGEYVQLPDGSHEPTEAERARLEAAQAAATRATPEPDDE